MSNKVIFTGNLASDPELRFTPAGAAVANFSVADTPRLFNKQTNKWEDGETTWWRCTAWREIAENVAESLTKGLEVIVVGTLKTRSYSDKNTGEKKYVTEVEVEHVGPSLRFATAQVTRVRRGSNNGGNSAPAQSQNASSGDSGYTDDAEPPF